jgi:hypothetical protein
MEGTLSTPTSAGSTGAFSSDAELYFSSSDGVVPLVKGVGCAESDLDSDSEDQSPSDGMVSYCSIL